MEGAYREAMQNRFVQTIRESRLGYLFRDVKFYGREAGIDFVESNLEQIVQEAVAMAGRKATALEINVHGFGRAAVDGMAYALRELTALRVEVDRCALRLTWA